MAGDLRSTEPPKRCFAPRTRIGVVRYSPFALGIFSVAFWSGCVRLDMLPPTPGVQPTTAQVFADIDPGETSLATLHFTVRGYTDKEIRPISTLAEDLYNKIGNDTGLYSFLASGSYALVVYRDREEYLQKTHQPNWSHAVTAGTSIYIYPGPDLDPVLAHELTHVVFNSFMGEKAASLRWLNEGLAMFEEASKMPESERAVYQTALQNQLRQEKLPFSQMVFFKPATEETRRIDKWYYQVESVVDFLLKEGSSLVFANMLTALRSGADIDRALQDNYPGKFRNLADLETAWKASL